MRRMLSSTPLRAALAAAWLQACAAVGPDYAPPQVAVPEAFHSAAEAGFAEEPAELAEWWRRLDDPVLDDLVARALADGHDVQLALARLDEARALRGVAAAGRWPTVAGRLDYEHRRESENTPFGAFASETDVHSVGLDAAWELDVFGRVRRSIEAADRDLEVSALDARDVAVTVAAETALAYVDLRAFEGRARIARSNVARQEATLALVRSRFDAGLVGERDVAQAAANLASTRARVPSLEAGARAARNRLAVLVGTTPGALAAEAWAPAGVPEPPSEVAVGVPADVLRRRADVRRAERAFAAEVARVGVAEAERYPRISLAGTLGLASDGLSTLLERDSVVAAGGPSVRWSLFDAGGLRRRVAAQSARAEQALIEFERAWLVALEEAENALSDFARERERRESIVEAAGEARRAVGFAEAQYREGLADFSVVLDSERELAELEDQLVASDASVATNLVALYKALGGGFEGAGAEASSG